MVNVLQDLQELATKVAEVINKVDGQAQEDPVWTAVKAALVANGWTEPVVATPAVGVE